MAKQHHMPPYPVDSPPTPCECVRVWPSDPHVDGCPAAVVAAAMLPVDQYATAYPRDPLAPHYDAAAYSDERPPPPCCKRIDHTNMIVPGGAVTWCTLQHGHKGQCSGPIPRELAPSAGYAVRLRGLQHDQFADVFEQRSKR